jgi:hypothetical protein
MSVNIEFTILEAILNALHFRDWSFYSAQKQLSKTGAVFKEFNFNHSKLVEGLRASGQVLWQYCPYRAHFVLYSHPVLRQALRLL